jgi:hypothetical protein
MVPGAGNFAAILPHAMSAGAVTLRVASVPCGLHSFARRPVTIRTEACVSDARHLYISARKRSGLRHAGKLAYPVKPLNVETLGRPIRAHEKQGNHPAGVIVDMLKAMTFELRILALSVVLGLVQIVLASHAVSLQ